MGKGYGGKTLGSILLSEKNGNNQLTMPGIAFQNRTFNQSHYILVHYKIQFEFLAYFDPKKYISKQTVMDISFFMLINFNVQQCFFLPKLF